MISISHHAMDQFCDRLHLPCRICHNQAMTAWRYGIRHAETRGGLNRYISGIYLRYRTANNVRISQGLVWVFCGSVLVTVWQLPGCFHQHVRSALRRRDLAGWRAAA
ncbi:MAG: hypothetical protein V1793_03195 [Pseudomonadota bacterium]